MSDSKLSSSSPEKRKFGTDITDTAVNAPDMLKKRAKAHNRETTQLERDLNGQLSKKTPLDAADKLKLGISNDKRIETKAIEENITKKHGGEKVYKIEDGNDPKLVILDKQDRLVRFIRPEDVVKSIGEDAEKYAVMHHINKLNPNGLKIGNINEILIDDNKYAIKQKITDKDTGKVTERAWILDKDKLDQGIKDDIDRDSAFGQKAPAKSDKAFALSDSMSRAVIEEAVADHLVQGGSEIVGWRRDGGKWLIKDTAGGEIKVFSPTEDQRDSIDVHTEEYAVQKYETLGVGGQKLRHVRVNNAFDGYDVIAEDGTTTAFLNRDKDLKARIADEIRLPDLKNFKDAKLFFDTTNTSDFLKDLQQEFKWAQRRRKLYRGVLTSLEYGNQAGLQEADNISSAIAKLMHADGGGGGSQNPNGPPGVAMTHSAMEHLNKSHHRLKKAENMRINMIKELIKDNPNSPHIKALQKELEEAKKDKKAIKNAWNTLADRLGKARIIKDSKPLELKGDEDDDD